MSVIPFGERVNIGDIYVHGVGMVGIFKVEKRHAKRGEIVLIKDHLHQPFIGEIYPVMMAEECGRIHLPRGAANSDDYLVLRPLEMSRTIVVRRGIDYKIRRLNWNKDEHRTINPGEIDIHAGQLRLTPVE